MNRNWVAVLSVVALVFAGCISAERKAEYAAWLASDDAVRNDSLEPVSLYEFEAKYQQGWRERAEAKKNSRLAREEKERQERLAREESARVLLACRQAEYNLWVASDDCERLPDSFEPVSLEEFESTYRQGWRERAEMKKKKRVEKAAERAKVERARLAKEAAERAEKMRLESFEKTVEHDLAAIKKCYSGSDRYENPFLGGRGHYRNKQSDWLSEWVDPRLGLTEADALAGEALLSEFGNKFMPKAYANYEKTREVALELQQVFNEEFPEPWKIKNTSPKWNSFNKVLERFAKARTEYFMCHDELCYYWMRCRLAVLTAEDFAQIDSRRIAVKLLPENTARVGYTIVEPLKLEENDATFAAKYAPESYALYQRLEQDWRQMDALVNEVGRQRIQLDAVRFDRAWHNALFKCNDLAREMNALTVDFQTWHVDHRTMEKSSEDVTKLDLERAKGLKSFVDSLMTYVKERTLGRVIAHTEMVSIPSRSFKLQRTEVTQMQWMIVMGNNPSQHIQPDCPVESVSWDDCQRFIKTLNEMEGLKYRLPTEAEWVYACCAGDVEDAWGIRRNGEEGPLEVMGWFNANSGRKTHPVAQKESNAWGFYDMHGNVNEWCDDIDGKNSWCHRYRGGSCNSGERECSAFYRARYCLGHDHCNASLGFRLAAPQD